MKHDDVNTELSSALQWPTDLFGGIDCKYIYNVFNGAGESIVFIGRGNIIELNICGWED